MDRTDAIDKIFRNVLREITPTEEERKEISAVIEKVKRVVESAIKPKGLSFTIAGSYMRDTWMRDKKEFDIFIMFPVSYSREGLEKEGLKLGKEIVKRVKGKYKIAYAEHPYVRAVIDGYDVDIVPCYKVESAHRIKSSVDRTPFHNEWLSKHLLKDLVDEVRLFKQFCKGIGVYGSDAKTQGFSGYLCELLIIHYRSFKNLLKNASEWKPGKVVINLEGEITDTESLYKKFPFQPLIVIDPVDPGRNVAAALSPENFIYFVSCCKAFLRKPSKRFFYKQPVKFLRKNIENLIKKRGTKLIAISFPAPDIISDVLWPQLRKTGRRLKNMIEEGEFKVMNWSVWSDEKKICLILFEFEVWELPKIRKLYGPSIFSEKHTKQFVKKYESLGRIWVENNQWVSEVKRKLKTPEDMFRETLKSDEKTLRIKGIPSYTAQSLSKKFKILREREILKLGSSNEEFGEFLVSFFKRDIKW